MRETSVSPSEGHKLMAKNSGPIEVVGMTDAVGMGIVTPKLRSYILGKTL
jgi:hypothetical protein